MLTRRGLIWGVVALGLAGAGVLAAGGRNLFYAALTPDIQGQTLSAEDAHSRAVADDITLIDIRRPDEWARTGLGDGAHPLDMRRADFIAALSALVDGKLNAPIAVICAHGVRSARMTNQMIAAGFSNVSDVPEGMLGSANGPGWIAKGLPLVEAPQ